MGHRGNLQVTFSYLQTMLGGKDVAAALGYTNTKHAILDHVDDEDRGVHSVDTPSGTQQMTVINKSGLYSLILSGKLINRPFFGHLVAEI